MSYEVGINWVASGVRVFPAVSVKTLRWEEVRFISIPVAGTQTVEERVGRDAIRRWGSYVHGMM